MDQERWRRAIGGCLVACVATGIGRASAENFTGWQALRVIEQEGNPGRLYAADLEGDGRDEAIVVNLRHARLDIYAWKEQIDDAEDLSAQANELPMAPEVERVEVAVRQTPIDVTAADLDGDGTQELYILVSDPNRLLRLRRGDDEAWSRDRAWDLLPGRYEGWDRLVRFVPDPRHDGGYVALVSMDAGFQQVQIDPSADDNTPSARPGWVPPRESTGRTDWWIGDLTGNGEDELIEWTNEDRLGVRVQPFGPASDENPSGLGPAETVHDERAQDVVWLPGGETSGGSSGGASLLILESRPAGVLRRYELSRGDAGPLGRRQPLALPGGTDAVWAVGTIDEQPTLLAADPGQPRIAMFHHHEAGWTAGPSFPVIADVKAIVAATGDPGRFFLWPDGGGDLFETRWDGKRLTYPRPIGLGGDLEGRLVLGLGTADETVWCVQKIGDDLTLHRWDGYGPEDIKLFAGVAGKAEAAKWIGGDSLLVADKFARSLRWVALDDEGQPAERQPPQLAGAKLDEFRLLGPGQALGRFSDGVFQRLDDGLQATDQVMLPNGVSLGDLVPDPAGGVWAMPTDGQTVQRMEPDDAGVLRVTSTSRVPGGRGLAYDERLGLLLRTDTGLTRLDAGRPDELEVTQNLDPDDGQPAGSGEASVNRLAATDLDGDGRIDALLFDDVRHQITAVGFADAESETDSDADLRPILSWPVFEDRAYPYGGGGENEAVREPRRVVALDLDGDGGQDLALLSHDRLLFYLAREPQR